MHIYTFIKVVPNTDKIALDPKTGRLLRESVQNILNPSDEIALFQALEFKKKHHAQLTALLMGPKSSAHALTYLLSLGFDHAWLINDPLFGGSDTLATSQVLSAATLYLGMPDLLFFGHHSADGETGHVPGQTATLLQVPCFSYTQNLSLSHDLLEVTQRTDYTTLSTTPFPAAFSWFDPQFRFRVFAEASDFFQSHPFGQLSNQQLNLPPHSLGLTGSPTRVIKIETVKIPSKNPLILPFSPLAIQKAAQLLANTPSLVPESIPLNLNQSKA